VSSGQAAGRPQPGPAAAADRHTSYPHRAG
jgi:hypothetical protein